MIFNAHITQRFGAFPEKKTCRKANVEAVTVSVTATLPKKSL